jgi:hypothetical protein
VSLLALVMIVKDEARSLRATLDSCVGAADRAVILDTGSTDGTQEIARAFAGFPVELHEGPFVDFSTTRNRAIDLAGEASTFTLMLSGDETLHGARDLRRFCERRRRAVDGAYDLRVHFNEARYDSPRLARAAAGWRYQGVTHEVFVYPGQPAASLRVPGAHVFHDRSRVTIEAARRKWERDLALLSAELERDPGDPRSWFYLAQTLECLGGPEDLARARDAYEQRAQLGGWHEEVYEALYRLGRVEGLLGRPWLEVQQRYLAAHAHSPHRQEPLLAIARHYERVEDWPLAHRFASWGAALPYPERARLFVDATAGAQLRELADLAHRAQQPASARPTHRPQGRTNEEEQRMPDTMQDKLDNWFSHHPPTDDQTGRYERLRGAGKAFAEAIVRETPASADQTAALRHVRDAVMTGNAAIACGGK